MKRARVEKIKNWVEVVGATNYLICMGSIVSFIYKAWPNNTEPGKQIPGILWWIFGITFLLHHIFDLNGAFENDEEPIINSDSPAPIGLFFLGLFFMPLLGFIMIGSIPIPGVDPVSIDQFIRSTFDVETKSQVQIIMGGFLAVFWVLWIVGLVVAYPNKKRVDNNRETINPIIQRNRLLHRWRNVVVTTNWRAKK